MSRLWAPGKKLVLVVVDLLTNCLCSPVHHTGHALREGHAFVSRVLRWEEAKGEQLRAFVLQGNFVILSWFVRCRHPGFESASYPMKQNSAHLKMIHSSADQSSNE